MPEVATPNQAEREFETGTDESFKNANATGSATHNENQRVTYANIKRTYDVYQDLDIQAARQSLIEQTRLNQIASQALQKAVETANIVGKRNLELNNLAHDSFWNPVASGAGMNLTAGAVPANRATDVSAAGVGVDAQAVAAAVAKQVDATVTPVLATLQQIAQALTTATTAIANTVIETLDDTFEPGALEALLKTFEGDYRELLDWWRRRLNATIFKRAQFPADIAAARSPQALLDVPRVVVGTIHSVKGGEADVVYLFPDLSGEGDAAYQQAGAPRDSVIRQFYVGMTRARETLYICQQESGMAVRI